MLKQQAIEILKKYEQEQIIPFLNNLSELNKSKLINQIINFNFKEVDSLYNELKNGYNEKLNMVEPVKYVEKSKLTSSEKLKYEEIGYNIIKKNKLAIITMAGGQGTRLGHIGPKGTYILDLKEIYGREISIFEVLAQNFLNAKKEYNVDLNWYIMTSTDNKEDTIKFFKKNDYFGLKKDSITFFMQPDIPVIDENGKLLIDNNYLIKMAGNGNGGIYEAISRQGVLEEIKKKGVEWVFVSGVDNILVNPIDPLFIGLTKVDGSLIASKATKKIDANEKAGVFCKKNGKFGVIEYSEISEELRNSVDENGELLYGQANIISHLYNVEALEQLANVRIRYHKAHKKGAYLDNSFQEVYPLEPNIYKFEKFIFDAFEKFSKMTILSVDRNEEFAPIKNAEGKDSPQTAIELYINKNIVM